MTRQLSSNRHQAAKKISVANIALDFWQEAHRLSQTQILLKNTNM
jgi:endonuclease/exonuclease/phosphatase family metal-dependent hydrolase